MFLLLFLSLYTPYQLQIAEKLVAISLQEISAMPTWSSLGAHAPFHASHETAQDVQKPSSTGLNLSSLGNSCSIHPRIIHY